jgi:2-succinyl-6-hydroxy-2,4-cyclohexadiene-1-carboxylate synthase
MPERLVFLHGFTQTHHHWHECAHLVAGRLPAPPTLAFVDLPGHGLSARDDRSIEDAAAVLGPAGGHGTYVAYSMGGRFALAAAALHPPEIEGLVLIGSTAGIDDPRDRAARGDDDEQRARRIEAIGVDAFVEEGLSMPMFSGHRFGPSDRRHRERNTAHGLASSLRHAGSGAQRPVWDALASISVPVLVLAGERDTKFTALGLRLAAAIPGATFAPIPSAGHAAHTEQPEATAALIGDWLLAQPTASPTVSSTP